MTIADVSDKSIAELTSLSGRCAVVTGGAQGLGKAIARRFAEAGASVLIADLNDVLARETAAELSASCDGRVISTRLDVADTAAINAAAELAETQLGAIDIWVNNAGIFPFVPLLEMTDDTWDQVMDVNLRGVFAGSRAAARSMIANQRGGVIINVASLAGLAGISPGLGAYVASKHGVVGATRQMALELAPHGIRVLALAPGVIKTETNFSSAPAQAEATIPMQSSKLGRIGVPDDIGRVALFCASDMALFMTGSTLLVDAGMLA
ncbi:SDR family NAD(P)-dependent oxidoreductase [Phenylobacterium sp. LjRoot219]|uniref:SDR family NAD(P)-dependent oxidoreductase n=1 Tax=Phenylobacterium sp. LjRoot219 TaxID=3342283 RepID=UPI003ECF6FCD